MRNLLLGRLDPDRPDWRCEPARWTSSRARRLRATGWRGRSASASEDAAAAVIRLANTHMAGAIRMVSLSRGYDPRDFVLFAFGGAGPLHAVAIARELGMPEVLVPARPGLTNALGCLVADLRQDFVNTAQRAARRARHGRRRTRRWRRSAPQGERDQRRGAGRDRRDAWCCTAPTCSSAARRI